MDGGDPGRWSAVAQGWAELWAGFARPAWEVIVRSSGVRSGSSVLDVGCGSGEFLHFLDQLGFVTAGIDPAPGMVHQANERLPHADIRLGSAGALPWPDGSFDLATSFNALHFSSHVNAALADMIRVVKPGGQVAVANWADAEHNDINTIEDAVARAAGREPLPDPEIRMPGGLEQLLRSADLAIVASGLVEVPWLAADDDTLVRGVLLGDDSEAVSQAAPVVIAAAQSFRVPHGGYRLRNAFRYAVGRSRTEQH